MADNGWLWSLNGGKGGYKPGFGPEASSSIKAKAQEIQPVNKKAADLAFMQKGRWEDTQRRNLRGTIQDANEQIATIKKQIFKLTYGSLRGFDNASELKSLKTQLAWHKRQRNEAERHFSRSGIKRLRGGVQRVR